MTPIAPVPDENAPEVYEDLGADADFQSRAPRVGAEFKHIAHDYLVAAGASFVRGHHQIGAYRVEGVVCGRNSQPFVVLAHGCLDDTKDSGLRRTDTVKKAGHDAHKISRLRQIPVLLITSHLPVRGTSAESQLADCASDIWDVCATSGDLTGYHRLERYLHDSPFPGQLPAPWRDHPSRWEPELFDVGWDQQIPIRIEFGARDNAGEPEEEF